MQRIRKELHRDKKWIPRKYETRRIKILHRGFRQIERLMHVSHVSVIDSLKKAAEELRRVEEEKKSEKEIEVLELDEMCISLKKHLTVDSSRQRK